MINTDNICDDVDVYDVIRSKDLWIYNKLQIAKLQDLKCGPAGIAVPKTDKYIVRPVVNFSGMGIRAEIVTLTEGIYNNVEPGMFWCELLHGDHISVDYRHGSPVSGYQGHRDSDNPLYKFTRWTKVEKYPSIPDFLLPIVNKYTTINIEYIDGKVIEVHLRGSPDPQYEEIIPVWSSDPFELDGYTYVESYEDCDGYLDNPRLGFYVR